MPENIELAYLTTRERQSRELALASDDCSVRIVHEKMAKSYAEQIKGYADEILAFESAILA